MTGGADGGVGEGGLRFFGTVSASISHEIKNVLAVIGESAGLLEDLVMMAAKGRPLDPERLKTLAARIAAQTRRADAIIKNMNTFAHSVDAPLKTVDAAEVAGLVAVLAGRLASMKGVNVAAAPAAGAVSITTHPYYLENLIWLCLDFSLNAAGGGKSVELLVEKAGGGARIRFARLEDLAAQSAGFPPAGVQALLERLKAKLAADPAANEIVLSLPATLEG